MSLSSIIAALISGGGQEKRDEKQWNRWVDYQNKAPERARAMIDVDLEKQRMLDLNTYLQKEASDEYDLGQKRRSIPVNADATAAQTLGGRGIDYKNQAEIGSLIAAAMSSGLSNENNQNLLRGQVLTDPATRDLLKAAYASQEAMPLANFKRGMTEEVGPGQYNRLNPTGVTNLDRLLGPNITLGSMSGVEQVPMKIGDQTFFKETKKNYPPVRRPLEAAPSPSKIPLDPALEQQALQAPAEAPAPLNPAEAQTLQGLINSLEKDPQKALEQIKRRQGLEWLKRMGLDLELKKY